MLQTIKSYIDLMPDDTFASYYQHYVVNFQDRIIKNDLKDCELMLDNRLKATSDLISNINILVDQVSELAE